MKIKILLCAAIFFASAFGVKSAATAVPQKEVRNLDSFIAREGRGPFNFWFAHPPDRHDPTVALIWMAEKRGKPPGEAEGALVFVEAENLQALKHLCAWKRGTEGTLTFLLGTQPTRVKIGNEVYLLRRFIL